MSDNSNGAVKVLKLQETHAEERARHTSDTATMLRLWSLLGNDGGLRDQTVGQRKFL